MTFRVVSTDDERGAASLEYVLRFLTTSGQSFETITPGDLANRLDRPSRPIEKKFQHTPEPLLDSWRAARRLTELTDPGDVVLMSDRRGLGGIFALEQAALDPDLRRKIWTVAADSAFLELRLVAKSHGGLPMPLDSQVDWEITQYRWSERVIATSILAQAELSLIGVGAELIGAPVEYGPLTQPDPVLVWAPGPVSRRNQSGEVLRAMTSIPDARIILSEDEAPDGIWTGTTWEALRHSREVLGGRLARRSKADQAPGVIVWGDPYSPPDPETMSLVSEGVPVVVPEGSIASLVWPEALTWTAADDLAEVLIGGALEIVEDRPSVILSSEAAPPTETPPRERKVSVGVPVFRDVGFLGECVESILAQDLSPLEVILYDDGSQSAHVDQEFARLVETDPRIRVMRSEHRGVCVSRNRMMEEMEGDTFLFVDSDDLILPTFLSRCATVLTTDAGLWGVATWTEFFGAYEAIEAKPPFDSRVGVRENPIISTSALVDMRVREQGIRFAPDLAFLYCEDWHFWSQIVAAGGRFGLVPQPLARHRVHPSSGGFLRTELAHAIGRSRATEPLLC